MRKILPFIVVVLISSTLVALHVHIIRQGWLTETDKHETVIVDSNDKEMTKISENHANSKETAELNTVNSDIQDAPMEPKEMTYGKGLFSWENEVRLPEERSSLYLMVNYLGIDEVYQDLSQIDSNDEEARNLALELELIGVDLYLLTGSSEWTYEADGVPMLEEIERADAFANAWGEDALKGIVFDIEPYGSERWKKGKRAQRDELMENLISGMTIAYEAAKKKGLKVILVIPTWYDQHYNEYFVQLSQCCDELSVMNYVKSDEYINMVDEVEYAQSLDMDLTCIFEFQRIGMHGLTEENTYYNEGIKTAVGNFEKLYQEFGYSNLKFAFHYLRPIEEMLLDWQH